MDDRDYRDQDSARESQHSQVLAEWRQKRATLRELDEAARVGLRKALREAVGEIGTETRRNIAKDIIKAGNREVAEQLKQHNNSGHLKSIEDMDPDLVFSSETGKREFTGYGILPWNRDK